MTTTRSTRTRTTRAHSTRARAAALATAVVLAGLAASFLLPSAQGQTTEASATDAPAPAPGRIEPCSLLTEAEAESALGTSVSAVETADQCTYVASDMSGRTVAAALPSGMPGREYLEAAMQNVATALNGDLHVVNGVGDEAYAVVGGEFSQLLGVGGERYVAVVLTSSTAPPSEQLATLTQLATTAFGRI